MKINKSLDNSPKLLGYSAGSPEMEVHRDTGLPKMIAMFQINNLTLHLQEVEETNKQSKEQVEGRK